MRKRSDNPIQLFQVGAIQRFPQPAEQSNFLRIEHTAIKVEPLRHSDAAVTTLDRFNRIRAGQHNNVAPKCSPGFSPLPQTPFLGRFLVEKE